MPTCDPTVGCHCVCQCDCPGESGGNGNTLTPEPAPTTGGTAKPLHDEETSAGPVRYFNGEVQLACDDVSARGFGAEWGHTRIYSNRLSKDYDFGNGYNWLVRQWPYLVQQGSTIVVMRGTRSTLWFDLVNGAYVARFGAKHTLTTSSGVFTLNAPNGVVTAFNDFVQTMNPSGSFKSQTTSGGQVTQVTQYQTSQIVEVQRTATSGGNTTVESILYTYAGGDIQTVLLRRQVNGGAWTNVSQATYTYYGGGANGSAGDLQAVTTQLWNNGAWQTTGNSYYRYWTTSGGPGLLHGLKYVVNPASYDRMVAAGITPQSASDSQLAQYADYYFEYDANRHVTKETVQGGAITYTFSLTQNTNSGYVDDYNNWKMKTVETLPDGSTNTVYTNYVGEVMLKQLSGTGGPWTTYTQFNSNADPTLHANPSAVSGFSDSQNNLGVTLNATSGQVHLYDYFEPTSVGGYLQNEKVQNGASGTIILLRSHSYTPQSSGGVTIYPIASDTAYRNDDGTGGVTTSYSYAFSGLAATQRTTTLPVISTSQNGSGTAATRLEQFDNWGNTEQVTDERNVVTSFSVDVVTGAISQRIEDATGMALVTDYQFDAQGRTTQALGPSHTVSLAGVATAVRTATWTVYDDANHQVRTAQGYATGTSPNYTYTLVNPVSITISNADGQLTDQIAATRASTSGALLPSDIFAQNTYVRWTHNVYNNAAQLTAMQVYFSIPTSGAGSLGTNYNETNFGYDADGRQNKVASPVGTITRTVHDPRGLKLSVYIGTNDTGATDNDPTGGGAPGNNMLPATINQYDGGTAGGDGNLTQQTLPVDSNSANNRVWTYEYDWRNRQTTINAPQQWYLTNTFDTMDRVIGIDRYSYTKPLSNLLERSKTLFDDRGRVYQTIVYGVTYGSPTLGPALTSNIWYDAAGNVIKQLPSGSSAFTKMVYDALGRQTAQYIGYDLGSGESSYASASDVSDDTIIEQVETAYDEAGNVIQTTSRQRFHNATGTGGLSYPGGLQPVARATYVAIYPDAIGRQQAVADYGTNGDSTLSRPATVPASGPGVLVNTAQYASDGTVSASFDATGTQTQFFFDQAGRKIKVIENVVASSSSSSSTSLPGCDDANHTTAWTYTADDQVATVTAVNAETGNQTTSYYYGISPPSSDIARNDLLSTLVYPDGGADQVVYEYNRQSQVKQFVDQNGTVHSYTMDLLGRLTEDAVTTLASGVDGSVRRIEFTYELRGMIEHVTSYDNPAIGQGNVVNDMQRVYNQYRQLSTEYQEHSGAVNTSTSVNVNYNYADGTTNTIRPMSLVYPSGRTLNLNYGTSGGMDDALSRVSNLIDNDGTTHLADYTHLGLASIMQLSSPQPGITWSLINGSGSDPYTGLDQFSRVADSRWYASGSGTDLDRIQHGYDLTGNRLWRRNTVADAAAVYLDELYNYDGIYRLKQLQRGQLNGADNGINSGTLSYAQAWGLDATGNWGQYWWNSNGSSWNLQQTRTSSEANEITGISGGGWATPVYDHNGNMTSMPSPASLGLSFTGVYDAWNRLISLSNNGSTVEANAYDGLNRRVTETVSGTARHFYYSVDWRVLEERLGTSSTPDRQFVWGLRYIDDLVLRDRGSERFYALQDPNWNVNAIADGTGAVQERYTYTAYGPPTFLNASYQLLAGSSYAWETLFAGYRWDSETGLYQVRHRFMHAPLGQWTVRDPLGVADGPNLYAYVGLKPIISSDPSGLKIRVLVPDEYFGNGTLFGARFDTIANFAGFADVVRSALQAIIGDCAELWLTNKKTAVIGNSSPILYSATISY